MRTLFVTFIVSVYLPVIAGCGDSPGMSEDAAVAGGVDTIMTQKAVQAQSLLSLADAERILGERAVLRDSASTIEGQATRYRCTYGAVDSNRDRKRRRVVYFLFEEYPNVTAAHEVYTRIKVANQDHEGIETLQGVGDEAYFHSDGTNFYYMMARKGWRGFRIKATKISSTTSYEEFNKIGRRIASEI